MIVTTHCYHANYSRCEKEVDDKVKELQGKDPEKWTEEELDEYELIVPDEVENIRKKRMQLQEGRYEKEKQAREESLKRQREGIQFKMRQQRDELQDALHTDLLKLQKDSDFISQEEKFEKYKMREMTQSIDTAVACEQERIKENLKTRKDMLDLQQHQFEMEIKQNTDQQRSQFDRDMKEMELKTQLRIRGIEEKKTKTQKEHDQKLQQDEIEHRENLEKKEEALKALKEENLKKEAEHKATLHQLQSEHIHCSTELDKNIHQARHEFQLTVSKKGEEMRERIAEERAQFQKELEEMRKRKQQETRAAFMDRVTRVVEITKPDQGTLRVLETEPGLASELASKAFGTSTDDI